MNEFYYMGYMVVPRDILDFLEKSGVRVSTAKNGWVDSFYLPREVRDKVKRVGGNPSTPARLEWR